ncbi:MAG: hypothetical protein AAGC81_11500 [Pseudomonadota bacterium]
MKKIERPVLGILRLDYDYPPALGDIDHPGSFNYEVLYREIPGLTFQMCQDNTLTRQVVWNCIAAVEFLSSRNVSGITGDCGFMVNIQEIIKVHTDKPVFLSCLMQLPLIFSSINTDAEVGVFTANSESLRTIEKELARISGIEGNSHRLKIVGCQDVPGFEAVALGERVDTELVGPGVIALAKEFIAQNPYVACILLECTELPPYANALRHATGLPVYDSITNCDAFMSGYLGHKNFGLQDWREDWSGTQAEYRFGDNLTEEERGMLVSLKLG